jgi:hypothetical protein
MILLAIIPVLSFLLLFYLFQLRENKSRENLLAAAVCWGSLVVLITEILSIFDAIYFWSVLSAWLLVSMALVLYLRKKYKTPFILPFGKIQPLANVEKIAFIGIGIVFAITGFIATVSAPNNADSFAYHLARIPYWLQNHSVQHYPTHILRQLYQPPWAEFALMHFQILTGNDYVANLLQWFCGLGTLVAVSLITKQLGGDRKAQILTMLLTATLPMLILQSSSTQNDLVMTFWISCFVYFMLKFQESYRLQYAILLGLAMGLAILTKGTAYLYVFPFCIYLLIKYLFGFNKKILIGGLVICLLALALNLGHYSRNMQVFGNPISPKQEGSNYANETHHPLNMLSNVVRNCSLHLGTYTESGNDFVHRYLKTFHYLIGVDESDKRTTSYQKFTMISNLSEDGTGNQLHFLFLSFTILLCFISLRYVQNQALYRYLGLVLSGFILFCVYLKWQPFHSRLHLALFALLMPFCVLVFHRKNWLTTLQIIAIFLLFSSFPWLFFSKQRPIINDKGKSILTNTRKEIIMKAVDNEGGIQMATTIQEAANYIKQHDEIRKIGLTMWQTGIDYPLYLMLDNQKQRYEIRHIMVAGEGKFEMLDFTPDVIFDFSALGGAKEVIEWNGKKYSKMQVSKYINTYQIMQKQ